MTSPHDPVYAVRPLEPEEDRPLATLVTQWRRKRDLPRETTQPLLAALAETGTEFVVLVDTGPNTVVGCLQLDRRAHDSTPPGQSMLRIAAAATDPRGGYRLGFLLTLWARHYAAQCGYTGLLCEVPLRHPTDSVAGRLARHLQEGLGWKHAGVTKALDDSRFTVARMTTGAEIHPTLPVFVASTVPVLPVTPRQETVS
ncbi:hypothetical protein [Streptomyces sp. NPDC059247]|uniref:hypothetical protein n=1 Tax=Streptomyces sp. NPDC059247 TaxID=3346790 RepID=UPI0036CE9FF5